LWLESEFVARQRAGKKEWREKNLGIGSAWKHQKYKAGWCKLNTKSFLFYEDAIVPEAHKENKEFAPAGCRSESETIIFKTFSLTNNCTRGVDHQPMSA
jgi:hypothetical protein